MHHVRALALAREAASRRAQLWTTWDVIGETVTLLRYRHSSAAAIAFLDDVKPGLRVMDYGANIRREAEQVFRRHSRDHRLSFCDAISFVVKDFVQILDIPWNTQARRKKAGRFRPDESDRVYRLARIAAMAAEVLEGKERAARWLREPNRGDPRPHQHGVWS